MVYNLCSSRLLIPFSRLLLVIIIIQIFTFSSFCLTDIDYSLRKLKNSEGRVSGEESLHGSNSAELLMNSEGSYSRIYMNLQKPLPLDELDSLSLWVNPQSGSSAIQIDIYLDGDGDGKYSSKSSEDARITSLERSWSDLQMSYDEWNELDGFDLDYLVYKDRSRTASSLDSLQNEMGERKVIRIYITVSSKDTSASAQSPTSVYIDYVRIGGDVISFEPLEEEEIKDGSSSAVAGGLITYTITYGNNNLEPADVIVREEYDPRTVFVQSYPPPDSGTFDTWTFLNLPAGAHGQIVIKMRTKRPSATAAIDGMVSGKGLTATHGLLSTEFESYLVANKVHIQAGEFNFSASASTKIRPIVGSTLEYGEHGSGGYQAGQVLNYSSASIRVNRWVLAASAPVQIDLSPMGGGDVSGEIEAREEWCAGLRAENDYRDILWRDSYWQAKSLNLSYTASLGKTLSSLETEAEVAGLADRKAVWPAGTAETHLSGNFSLAGRARWRYANKSISAEKLGLECCPGAVTESTPY